MIAKLLVVMIAVASAPGMAPAQTSSPEVTPQSQPSTPSNALPQPTAFDMAMADWASCERPRLMEMATRLGRAGPGGNANLDGLHDCGAEEARLAAVIEALPTTGARDAAKAQLAEMRAGFRAEMDDIYARNNHE